MQVIHDEIADLDHVEVQFLLAAQERVFLELAPRHFEQLVEEVAEPEEVQIAGLSLLMEELVADGRLPQLHDEIIDRADAIFDLTHVISRHLMWVHLFSIWLAELSGELLVLLLRDQVRSKFVHWLGHQRLGFTAIIQPCWCSIG